MELIDTRHPQTAVSAAARRVLDYCRTHDLAAKENGQHLIDGEDFYVNIFQYTTKTADQRIWEAHRQYIDVHVVLHGQEIIGQQFLPDCTAGAYHPDSDYLEISAAAGTTRFTLAPGFLAVFYPEDAHQTGVLGAGQTAAEVRKAVFKIRL